MRRVVVALLIACAACGGGGSSTSHTDAVPQVVAGSTTTWTALTVKAGGASADVPSDARERLTPLRASRVLDPPAPLGEYGLDHPQAVLVYKGSSGATVEVDLGQPNFDRHFVYAQRRGRAAVYLLPADTLRPVLALVGIEISPPE